MATVTSGKPVWDLAVCAQFYYPYGDKRKSHRRFYLMSLDGKRKLPIGGKPAPVDGGGFIRWIDRSRLAWIEVAGKSYRVVEKNLRTGDEIVRARWPVPTGYRPFVEDACKLLGVHDGENRGEGCELVKKGDGYRLIFGAKDFPIRNDAIRWTISGDLEGEDTFSLDQIGPDRGAFVLGVHGDWTLAAIETPYTAHVAQLTLFRIDRKKQEAAILPADLEMISVRPTRDLWAGRSSRNLGSYTKYDVWASRLSVGHLTRGPSKVVMQGRMRFFDVSLRP